MAKHITHTPQETAALGRALAQGFTGGEVVALNGELGAGKTVFCSGMAQGLGSTDPVQSPTFAIVNYYRGRVPFAHFDAWRIQTADDLETAGFYDYLEEGAVLAVEWFENIAAFAGPATVQVSIRPLGDSAREIDIKGAATL